MSTPGVYHDECGGYHEYTGRCSVTPGEIMSTLGDTTSTSGILVQMRKDHYQISRIFVLTAFAAVQLHMLAFGTSVSLLKFLYHVARAQTLAHFLFHL